MPIAVLKVGPPECISLKEFSMWAGRGLDRKSTRLNSSHVSISYAVFCLKKKKIIKVTPEHSAYALSVPFAVLSVLLHRIGCVAVGLLFSPALVRLYGEAPCLGALAASRS